MSYLNPAEFRDRTIMPDDEVDSLNERKPSFVEASIDDWTSFINTKLAKRYDVPFDKVSDAEVPRVIKRWMTSLVTRDAYMGRGFSPSSEQDAEIQKAAERAEEQIQEAADSEKALFDLPERQSKPEASGVRRGGPQFYAEASPYRWRDRQIDLIDADDS